MRYKLSLVRAMDKARVGSLNHPGWPFSVLDRKGHKSVVSWKSEEIKAYQNMGYRVYLTFVDGKAI